MVIDVIYINILLSRCFYLFCGQYRTPLIYFCVTRLVILNIHRVLETLCFRILLCPFIEKAPNLPSLLIPSEINYFIEPTVSSTICSFIVSFVELVFHTLIKLIRNLYLSIDTTRDPYFSTEFCQGCKVLYS